MRSIDPRRALSERLNKWSRVPFWFLVERRFAAEVPNWPRVADIINIPTCSGFLYVAVMGAVSSAGRWPSIHDSNQGTQIHVDWLRAALQGGARTMAVSEFIENWCNPSRRHFAIGLISPIEFERRCPRAL